MRKIIIFLVLFLLSCGLAGATDYYVSPTGDDANDGLSAETPKLSMDLSYTLTPGDTLHLAAGTHTVGKLKFNTTAGNATHHISIVGDTGAIVDAMGGYGVEIKKYGVALGYYDIYNFEITNGTDGFYIEAPSGIAGTNITHDITVHDMNIHDVGQGFDIREIGTVHQDVYNLTIYNCTIYDFDNSGIYSQGTKNAYIHNNYIANSTVSGAILLGVGYTLYDSTVENNTIENVLGNAGFYSISGSADTYNVTVKNNTIRHNQGRGIRFDYRAYDMKINNNNVTNMSYALNLYPDTHSTARNNTFTDCGFQIVGEDEANLYDNTLTKCTVLCSGGAEGIGSMLWKNNTLDNSQLSVYGHENTLLENNIVKNYAGNAIQLYTSNTAYNVTNLTIKNNVFYNVTKGVYLGSEDLIGGSIRNNIFADVTNAVDNTLGLAVNTTVEYNCVIENASDAFVNIPSTNSIFAPVLFLSENDFRIKYASPCKDAGKPTDDYTLEPENNGDRIDIGAYGNTVNAPYLPTAAFTANNTSATAPKDVLFYDNSTGGLISSWSWDFNGDTTEDSTDQNPVYSYASDGTYTVSLTVENEFGSDTETKTGYIVLDNPPYVPIILTTVAAAILFMRARRRW
jgi:PKD repeat protein